MSVKVAVRLPDILHAALLKIAKNEGTTFTVAIVGALNDALWGQSPGMARADQKQSGDGAAVSVLPTAESEAVRHALQTMRGALAGRGGYQPRPKDKPICAVNPSHRTYRNGAKAYCSDCGEEF
jgi:hypothetical protein